MRAIGSYMTKNILILFAFVLLASTSNWVPLYTDGTLTGGGYEDSPLGVDTSKVATTYDLMSAAGGASYDVYTATLTQEGTDDPVAIVLENTLGGTVVWDYISTGNYSATLTGVFTVNKTTCFFALNAPSTFGITYDRDSDDVLTFQTSEEAVPSDDILYKSLIEIRVYP